MSGASASTGGDDAVYLYGIAYGGEAVASVLPSMEGIVDGAAVELLPVGKLALVMSRVSKEAFAQGEGTSDATRDWVTERALAHHRVLSGLAACCTVAPMKFGVLCLDMPAVVALLAEAGDVFEQALHRVMGAREWGVKLFADTDTCRARIKNAPAITALRVELAAASPGLSFFLGKRLQAAIEEELSRHLTRRAESVHGRLAYVAREVARGPAKRHLVTPAGSEGVRLILDAACLVEKDREAEFQRMVDDLGAGLGGEGFSLKCTGPWPPYNFADINAGRPSDGRH